MLNCEPHGETPFTADDGIADYDDGVLGCEAMIGELGINYCRPRYEAISVKAARLQHRRPGCLLTKAS